MKIKNCKFINSIKLVSKELTYVQSDERGGVELTLIPGFVKIKTPRIVKLIPLSNVTDMHVEDEQIKNAERPAQNTK